MRCRTGSYAEGLRTPGRRVSGRADPHHEVWVQLFELAGVDEEHYLHETELRDRTLLPDTVHLYRAAAEGHQTGLSWTASFERAHWFATRLGGLGGHDHQIYEITAPREAVLATFHATRREHEYVIDTGRIDPTMPGIVEEHRRDSHLRPRRVRIVSRRMFVGILRRGNARVRMLAFHRRCMRFMMASLFTREHFDVAGPVW